MHKHAARLLDLHHVCGVLEPDEFLHGRMHLREPFGRKLMYVSLGMLAVGGIVIRQLVNGIEV